MNPAAKTYLIAGLLLAGLSVAIGAFGAHALKAHLLAVGRMDTYQTAVSYQFYHALALIVLALWASHKPELRLEWPCRLILAGIVIFSGSLYLLCLTGVGWLGAITPIGGTAWIAAWALAAWRVAKSGRAATLALLLSAGLWGCQSASDDASDKPNRWANLALRQVVDLQTARDTQGLLAFFGHADPVLRESAVLAFGSIQDTTAIDTLLAVLSQDKEEKVRLAAAYALGQTAHADAESRLIYAMQDSLNGWSMLLRAVILEAIGKCATREGLTFLAELQYENGYLILGQARGIYRAMLKGVTSPAANDRMLSFIHPNQTPEVRQIASYYLARHQGWDAAPHLSKITGMLRNDRNEFVRMNMATVLGRIPAEGAQTALLEALRDKHDAVRVAALRALAQPHFDHAAMQQQVGEYVFAPSEHVSEAAVRYLAKTAKAADAPLLRKLALRFDGRMASAIVLAAAQRVDPSKATADLIRQAHAKAESPYLRGELLKAIAENPAEWTWIREVWQKTTAPVEKSLALEALAIARKHARFAQDQQSAAAFAEVVREAIRSRDAGQISIAAPLIREPALQLKAFFDQTEEMHKILAAIALPQDVEAFHELAQAIAWIEGKPAPALPRSKPAAIDWTIVQSIPENQEIQVQTTKGTFHMRLLVNDAPATVAQIVRLTKEGFFDGKTFHRIIPNFVTQGGCPRGDGFGGIAPVLPSELAPLSYLPGAVGMASAGKDTESCQWFVTHIPTPHLDGRYTLFAGVAKGLDVVKKLEIGDKIIKMTLL